MPDINSDITISLIVAMAQNNCIGKDNKMPWHLPEDLKHFKTLTMGHPVIMGRKTFESILGYLGKPLPGRTSIIVSRSGYETLHTAHITRTIEEAIDLSRKIAKKNNKKEAFIIGGAQIYNSAINLAKKIHLTQIHESVDGDAFFPEIRTEEWHETSREDHKENPPPYSFLTLEKKLS